MEWVKHIPISSSPAAYQPELPSKHQCEHLRLAETMPTRAAAATAKKVRILLGACVCVSDSGCSRDSEG